MPLFQHHNTQESRISESDLKNHAVNVKNNFFVSLFVLFLPHSFFLKKNNLVKF